MKIDKSTALFLSNVLFHYEQLMRDSKEDEVITAVRLTRQHLNDGILSGDKPNLEEDEDEDEDIKEENDVEPSYVYNIEGTKLFSLPALKTIHYGKLKFKRDHNKKISLFESLVGDEQLVCQNIKYVKRNGKKLYVLTQSDISEFSDECINVDDYEFWNKYQVNKFPLEWIDAFICGLVYKCV